MSVKHGHVCATMPHAASIAHRHVRSRTVSLGEQDDAIFIGSCGRCPRTGRVGGHRRAGAARCAACRRTPQPPPQNLQVLPKDMPRAQVVQIMQNFNAALGVTCDHCHVFVGPSDPMNDFAADTKPTKTMARAMMLMVRRSIRPCRSPCPRKRSTRSRLSNARRAIAARRFRLWPPAPRTPPPPRGAGPGAAPGTAPPANSGRFEIRRSQSELARSSVGSSSRTSDSLADLTCR